MGGRDWGLGIRDRVSGIRGALTKTAGKPAGRGEMDLPGLRNGPGINRQRSDQRLITAEMTRREA